MMIPPRTLSSESIVSQPLAMDPASMRSANTWRRLSGRFVAALVAVFFLAGPYIADLLEQSTRLFQMWRREDALVLAGGVLLAAAACVAVGEIIRRTGSPRLINLFNHLFVATVAAGLFANLCFHSERNEGWHFGRFSMETQTLWLLLAGVIGYSYARGGTRLVRRCRQFCMIVLPGVIIVFVQLFTRQEYPRKLDPWTSPARATSLVPGEAGARTGPIYLFLFDEWSYVRTFADGHIRAGLPNLDAFCQHTTVYHDAHSPADCTSLSVPCLLLQNPLRAVWDDGRMGFEQDGTLLSPAGFSTLFEAAGPVPRLRVLVEWVWPCHLWLGDRVDVVRSYPWYAVGPGPIKRLRHQAFWSTYHWTDPWFRWLYTRFERRVKDGYMLTNYEAIRLDAIEVINHQPAETFAIVHVPLPHYPAIVEPDGSYRGPKKDGWEESSVEGYRRNLNRVDYLLGELTDAMKAAGRYDDAMIILTSDHSWRFDPARRKDDPADADAVTHVPLIVKRPGQTSPAEVYERFETWRLGDLIRAATAEEQCPQDLSGATAGIQIQTSRELHDIHGKSAYVQ